MDRNIKISADTGQIFEWDEHKNELNIAKHGLDFADSAYIFAGTIFTRLDVREDYGEERWLATGMLDGRVIVVVYTEPSENVIRMISARKALPWEQNQYEKYL
jgi:uncharacterized DUF497 family protein